MRVIVHLSDLHFDLVDPRLVQPCQDAIQSIKPDVVAVAGDLTQHATRKEFESALRFLEPLPGLHVVVPGNHDLSFYNPLRRATEQLRLFRQMVSSDPEPFYRDSEIAVLGLNTVRVSHLRDGRIRRRQVDLIEKRMQGLASDVVRILVTHHPFDLPTDFEDRELIGRGREYLPRVVRCVDVLLAGHMHISHAGPTALRFGIAGISSVVFVQAGTALSTRTRSETNSFQVLRVCPGAVETEEWRTHDREYSFRPGRRLHFFRTPSGDWTPGERTTESILVAPVSPH